jgi:RNA polymerase sigma-70 factor (ECF subfamily)
MSTERQSAATHLHTQAQNGEQDEQHAEETRWITRALTGDHAAFALLFERYQSMVYTHVYYRLHHPQDAQDAVQEIFRRVYLKLDTFDTSKRFRNWLLTIATNYCTDVIRKRISVRNLFQAVPLDVVEFSLADTEANPEKAAHMGERRAVVWHAIHQLPDKYREVVLLFYWNDMSYEEIRTATGLPESTIKTRLHRAREKLVALLETRREDML